MAITLYDLTVPVFLRGLGVMSAVLEKGRAHAEAAGIEPGDLVDARLAADMLTLAGQVQRASDTAKFTCVRIGGVENVRFADEEKSFADLQERLARTRDFLEWVPRAAIEEKEGATIEANIGRSPIDHRGGGLCAEVRGAQLLFPCHHGLRHPAVAGRGAGQDGLYRRAIS